MIEFLIATAALRFKEEGAELLSLSGAPLARLDRNESPDALERVLDQIGRGLEPVYGFRSLLAFKSKFQPEYDRSTSPIPSDRTARHRHRRRPHLPPRPRRRHHDDAPRTRPTPPLRLQTPHTPPPPRTPGPVLSVNND